MSKRSLALLAGAAAALAVGAPAAGAAEVDVVARGLDNPRGLDVVGQHVYVAEAGRGGDRCATVPGEEGPTQVCAGLTGKITRVDLRSGAERRIGQRLPSVANVPNELGDASGPHDVSLVGRYGRMVTGLGADPAARAAFGDLGAQFGLVWRLNAKGGWSRLADVAAFEAAEDPDAQFPGSEGADSNPYSVQIGETTAVADAGGNSLVGVDNRGRQRLLAAFPPRLVPLPPEFGGGEIPMQAVPDAVDRGPGGDFYVGGLSGFPFPRGGAAVWRVPAAGGTPEVVAEGFTTISDIAVGVDRSIWVLELTANGIATPDPGPGRLIRVGRDGTRSVVADGLVAPTGLALERGVAYVSNKGLGFGQGEVLRIRR
jgi:hypothetical protein